MRELTMTDAALRNLDEIFLYLSDRMDDLVRARDIIEQLVEQCEKMAALPILLGRPRDELSPGLRSFPFRGYMIFMIYRESALEIVNILHGRRDIDAFFEDDA
ncbi:type II toxin-antitoxin system RelE/ParE family toxin [Methylosinus sporium]|nr:type II toxin-antitoxin system RelE/ParE family toxin [Methylosinus sporium]